MAIPTKTQLTLTELELLLDCRNKTLTYHLLSATRQKAIGALHDRQLVEDFMDDESRTLIRISQNGSNLLASLLVQMNNWTRSI